MFPETIISKVAKYIHALQNIHYWSIPWHDLLICNVDNKARTIICYLSFPSLPSFNYSRCLDRPASDSEQQVLDHERMDRSLFVQELILSTLTGQLQQHDELDLSSLSVEQSVMVPNQTGPKDAKPAAATKKILLSQSKSTRPKSVTNSSQPLPRTMATVSHSGFTGRSTSNHVNSSPLPSYGSNSGQGAEPGSGLGSAATHSRPTAGSTRDARVNPSASKRTMLKHLESNKTAEKEPPPH